MSNGLTVALQSGGPCVPFGNTDIPQQRYDCARMAGDSEKPLSARMDGCVSKPIQVEIARLTQSRIANDGKHMNNADNSAAAFVDIQELLARVENDRELLCDLLTIFKQEFPTHLKSLEQAVAHEDPAETASVSHTLKGMLANLSVTKAAASVARLEQLARAGETAALPGAFAAFAQDVHGLLPVMENYMLEARQ